MKKLPFVWEIGCEEIPARWLSPLIADLREKVEKSLAESGFEVETIETYGTLRRLVVHVPKLPERQPDRREQIIGPPLRIARDESGEWTKAAIGFARKNDIEPNALQVISTDKGDYLGFQLEQRGQKTIQLLPTVMASSLRSLNFPKFMNWDAVIEDGKGDFLFGRPIRWMVSLFGGKVVPLAIKVKDGPTVVSGAKSRGHRFLAPKGVRADAPFKVSSFRELKQGLKKRYVLLDPEERRERLEKELTKLEKKAGTKRAGGLSAQLVAEFVEWPGAVLGFYSEELRSLPEEVRHTVLIHHQHYFPLRERPAFIAVTNMASDPKGYIRKGCERVVMARLRDAEFFWKEDLRIPLSDRLEELDRVVFHQKLGSYRRKVERVIPLALWIASSSGAREQSVRRVAELSKCDLVTGMVGEFPELQGIMGGLYAKEQGETESVWKGVYSHYQPVGAEDEAFPLSREGAVVSLADKLDSLAAMFSVGLMPTGSRDPFALRRLALGAIRLLLESGEKLDFPIDLSLEALIQESVKVVKDKVKDPSPSTASQLGEFFRERLRYVFGRRFRYDEVNAVFARDPLARPLTDLQGRLEAVAALRGSDDFEALSIAFKRVRNILTDSKPSDLDVDALAEKEEQKLFAAMDAIEPEASELIGAGRYDQALKKLSSLRRPVDLFFDKVLVMAEDEKLRTNRLALLDRLSGLFTEVADLSEIVAGEEA